MKKVKNETRNNFSLAVERKAVEENLTYLDALTSVVEECSIEPIAVKKLVNQSLKDKLEKEASEMNLIKTKTRGSRFIE